MCFSCCLRFDSRPASTCSALAFRIRSLTSAPSPIAQGGRHRRDCEELHGPHSCDRPYNVEGAERWCSRSCSMMQRHSVVTLEENASSLETFYPRGSQAAHLSHCSRYSLLASRRLSRDPSLSPSALDFGAEGSRMDFVHGTKRKRLCVWWVCR